MGEKDGQENKKQLNNVSKDQESMSRRNVIRAAHCVRPSPPPPPPTPPHYRLASADQLASPCLAPLSCNSSAGSRLTMFGYWQKKERLLLKGEGSSGYMFGG